MQYYSVFRRVKEVYTRGQAMLKIPKERRDKMLSDLEKTEASVDNGRRKKKKLDTFENLFDICPCKHISRDVCDCPASQKVPQREFLFLLDQRTDRKMIIFDVDGVVSKAWKQSNKRKEKIMRKLKRAFIQTLKIILICHVMILKSKKNTYYLLQPR